MKPVNEGYGKRLIDTVTAIIIIGGPVSTWASGIVVGLTSVFLYPILPDGNQWLYMVASWVICIPPAVLIGMLTAVKLVNMFLTSAGMKEAEQPRDSNGRYVPMLKNGKKRGYIAVEYKKNGSDW